MEDKLQKLRKWSQETQDLVSCLDLLEWDQATQLPPKAAEARGRQMAVISKLVHQRTTSPTVRRWLSELASVEPTYPVDSNEATFIRVMRREYERESRLPEEFVGRLSEHQAKTYQSWVVACEKDRFAYVAPDLEELLQLTREYASYFPEANHFADPLIAREDLGVDTALVKKLFSQLKQRLQPMIQEIIAKPKPDVSFLQLDYPKSKQLTFVKQVIQQLGFDLERGRLDLSPHPFMIALAHDDVRITTRVHSHDPLDALFGSIHETGHALYELGIDKQLEGTPLHRGASSFLHESQSRLWENRVGRRSAFWRFFYPQLQAVFPSQLGNVPLHLFMQGIQAVQPSLIRTEADEVTYNLHVIIRFELELALLEGQLTIRELPDAWRDAYDQAFGITPSSDREGVLQDVHWYSDMLGGMFQSYALGNIVSGQIFQAASQALPDLDQQMEQGNFSPLRVWLTEHLYRHGNKFLSDELIHQVTGSTINTEPYLRDLEETYL